MGWRLNSQKTCWGDISNNGISKSWISKNYLLHKSKEKMGQINFFFFLELGNESKGCNDPRNIYWRIVIIPQKGQSIPPTSKIHSPLEWWKPSARQKLRGKCGIEIPSNLILFFVIHDVSLKTSLERLSAFNLTCCLPCKNPFPRGHLRKRNSS